MKYAPPVGASNPDEGYVNENLAAGIEGSPVPAEAIEPPMREIVHVIKQAGLVPDDKDLTQLYLAVQKIIAREQIRFLTCTTPGSVTAKEIDAGTLTLAPGSATYVSFSDVNAVPNPTLNISGTGAKPILCYGVPPEVGQLAAGQVYTMIYSGSSWQIIGGMSPYPIMQYRWWDDGLIRPGFVPANANVISGFAAKWPQAAAYLSTAHGAKRCFASLAEYEAAHTATWATLADGSKVGWNAIGGVAKFFWNKAADTLLMPDLTEMTRFMSGASLGVGEVHGDQARPVVGDFETLSSTGYTVGFEGNIVSKGALCLSDKTGNAWINAGAGTSNLFRIDSGRVGPIGPANAPRRFGSLACVYLGIPR